LAQGVRTCFLVRGRWLVLKNNDGKATSLAAVAFPLGMLRYRRSVF